MAIKITTIGGTDWNDGDVLFSIDAIDTLHAVDGSLGEIKMVALSMTNAITKAALQTRGWAICDGTTPAAQGISSPTITTTPNLEHHFIRMSDDETSGTTGGSDTIDLSHTHSLNNGTGYDDGFNNLYGSTTSSTGSSLSATQSNLPTYYELVFFIKVAI